MEKEEEEEEEEQVMDLDELLRNEQKREKEELKDIPEPPEVAEPETDSDKLSPYKNDLEYLDDHFQVSKEIHILQRWISCVCDFFPVDLSKVKSEFNGKKNGNGGKKVILV